MDVTHSRDFLHLRQLCQCGLSPFYWVPIIVEWAAYVPYVRAEMRQGCTLRQCGWDLSRLNPRSSPADILQSHFAIQFSFWERMMD